MSSTLAANINKCYYAGKLSGDPIEIINIIGLGSGFSFDIWFYPTNDNYELITIKDFITIRVINNEIVVEEAEQNTINKFDVIKCAWNNVSCICDAESLTVYMHGCECYTYSFKRQIPSHLNCSVCNEFIGYIRSVRIYNTLADDVLRKYIYKTKYDSISTPEVLAWLDFNSSLYQELTGNPDVNVALPPNFLMKKVSHGLRADDDTYAFAYVPKIEADKSVSLCFCVFLENSNQDKQVLFTSNDCYSLFLKKNTDSNAFVLCCSCGDTIYEFSCDSMHPNGWYVIMVSTDNSGKTTAYVRSSKGVSGSVPIYTGFKVVSHIKFGNGFFETATERQWFPFAGYISKAAIYGRFFSEDDVSGLSCRATCVYDRDLVALYNFDGGIAIETCLLSEIRVRDDNLVLFELSDAADLNEVTYSPVLKMPNYPSYELLEPSIILDAIVQFYEKMYGLVPDSESFQHLKMYAPLWLMRHASVQNILLHRDTKQEDIVDLLRSLDLEALFYLFSTAAVYSSDDKDRLLSCVVLSTVKSLAIVNDIVDANNISTAILETIKLLKTDYKSGVVNNFRAYDALKIDNSGCESFVEIINLTDKSLDGSFSLDIWFYPESGAYNLISQVDSFDVYVHDKSINFSYLCGNQRKTHSIDGLDIIQNTWNNFALSYDNNTVVFYLHGLEIYSLEIGSQNLLHDGLFKVGKGFNGYIRSLNFYPKIIKADELRKLIYQSDSAGELSNIVVHGSCIIDNVVHVFCPDSTSCAVAEANDVKIGQFDSDEFSIFARFFSLYGEHNKGVLLSNGSFSDQDSIIICVSNIYKNIYSLVLKIDEQEFLFDEVPIYNNCWNDVLVTFRNDTHPNVYLNGKLLVCSGRKSAVLSKVWDGKVVIGSCPQKPESLQSTYPFNGYISSVAIFDKLLSQEDAVTFHNGSSLLYTDGLVAYYDFSDGVPSELISRSTITGFEHLNVVVGTNDDKSIIPQYNNSIVQKDPVIDKRELLKRDVVLQLFSAYFEKVYAVIFNSESLDLLKLYGSFGVSYGSALNNLIYQTDTLPSDVVDAIKTLTSDFFNWFLEGVNTAPINSLLRTKILAIVALIDSQVTDSKLIDDIVEIIKEVKKHSGYNLPEVSVLSLTFQYNPDDLTSSATYCRNINEVINGSEWKQENGIVKKQPILYVTEKLETVNVKAVVFVDMKNNIPNNSRIKISMIDKSENKIFNTTENPSEFVVSATGEYEVVLSLTHNMKKESIFCYTADLEFKYSYYEGDQEIQGATSIISDFALTIYALPKIPANPISLFKGNEDRYPIIDLIDIILCDKNVSQDSDPVHALMHRLYNNNKLKFVLGTNNMNEFSIVYKELVSEDEPKITLKTDVISFDIFKFVNSFYAHDCLSVDSEVYALLLMYGFCLLGKEAVVSHIIPPLKEKQDDHEQKLQTRFVFSAGCATKQSFTLDFQAVVENSGLIYDASLRVAQDELLAGLIFEKDEYSEENVIGYVDKVFIDETVAMPGGITNDVSIKGLVCQITPVEDEEEN